VVFEPITKSLKISKLSWSSKGATWPSLNKPSENKKKLKLPSKRKLKLLLLKLKRLRDLQLPISR
jgi:hypothetical protein